ncbi:hypothetical protein [Bradyrhizobium genosp. P]|uniref:hypothetical protein n=1 Tax=Bradyrhizobium genosp. P TaxID=83641 RepID=UPI003CF9DB20
MIASISGGQLYSADYALGYGESLCSTMILILTVRFVIYDTQIRSEYDSMRARNDLLKDMNAVLAALRTNRPNDEKSVKDYGTFVNSRGETKDVFDWMDANGISIEHSGDKAGVQADFDAAINNVKGAMDSANSETQMMIIRLQDLLGKFNSVAELMSNLVSKDQKLSEMIVGNIR